MSLLLFALDVFSPSRGTYVQLRGEENAILYQSHKPEVSDVPEAIKVLVKLFQKLVGFKG